MFTRSSLPKKADIFITSKRTLSQMYPKPLLVCKLFTAVVLGIAVLLTGAFILIPQSNSDASSTTKHVQAQMVANHDHDDRNRFVFASMPTPFPVFITNKTLRFRQVPPVAVPPVTVPPVQTPPPFQNTVSISNPITTMVSASSTSTVNQTGAQNIGGIASQLIAIQQQIANQMQGCVSNAQQMANQIIALQNQQKQLQAQIDSLNNQSMNIDTSTQSGQSQQNAINQQITQLQQESDNLGNNINTAQDNFNSANGQCQQNVSNLEQQRGTLEGNLDDAFNNAMNIQFPQ